VRGGGAWHGLCCGLAKSSRSSTDHTELISRPRRRREGRKWFCAGPSRRPGLIHGMRSAEAGVCVVYRFCTEIREEPRRTTKGVDTSGDQMPWCRSVCQACLPGVFAGVFARPMTRPVGSRCCAISGLRGSPGSPCKALRKNEQARTGPWDAFGQDRLACDFPCRSTAEPDVGVLFSQSNGFGASGGMFGPFCPGHHYPILTNNGSPEQQRLRTEPGSRLRLPAAGCFRPRYGTGRPCRG
jgi:hypothetical protein